MSSLFLFWLFNSHIIHALWFFKIFVFLLICGSPFHVWLIFISAIHPFSLLARSPPRPKFSCATGSIFSPLCFNPMLVPILQLYLFCARPVYVPALSHTPKPFWFLSATRSPSSSGLVLFTFAARLPPMNFLHFHSSLDLLPYITTTNTHPVPTNSITITHYPLSLLLMYKRKSENLQKVKR